MTTKRLRTSATSREGVNFVRAIVEAENSIFQDIEQSNDIGNDAYIEFVSGESGTGCCIACQIKSGRSYVSESGGESILRSDKDHFEYWASHSLPIAGIVVDFENDCAVWINITQYLQQNPNVIESGPYNIRISREHVFSKVLFSSFKQHFFKFSERYRSKAALEQNIGIVLEDKSFDSALASLRALFAFHRNEKICWYFLITYFSFCSRSELLVSLLYCLTHIPGHGDIAWGEANMLDNNIREWALRTIQRVFRRREIERLLSIVDPEEGFGRGTAGQSAYAIISAIPRHLETLYNIAVDSSTDEDVRFQALLLVIYDIQMVDIEHAQQILRCYCRENPSTKHEAMIRELSSTLREGVPFSLLD